MFEITFSNIAIAFGISLAAGLFTVLGSGLVMFSKTPNPRVLSFGLAFAGGAMVYVSLTEIFNNVSLTGQEILRIFADEDHNTQHTKNDENDTYNLRNTDRIPALLHRTDQRTATTERSGNLGRTVSK